ncbi:MAG: nucleotidyltransferase domain-containing protein [Atribacterota bacterium]|nr:nucleotidyltransferase domain-containing protein [Atribacterota bacterium]
MDRKNTRDEKELDGMTADPFRGTLSLMKLEEIVIKKKTREEKLQEALKRIIIQLREWGALKVILFGSPARGIVDSQSDLDLLVIMPPSKTSKEWMDQIY